MKIKDFPAGIIRAVGFLHTFEPVVKSMAGFRAAQPFSKFIASEQNVPEAKRLELHE